MEESNLLENSLFIEVEDQNLHLKNIFSDIDSEPVLLIHGSMENAKIYYSKSLKGFAPYLACNFNTFSWDLRGRGDSEPKLSKKSKFNHNKIITTDMKAVIDYILDLTTKESMQVVCHSWGGVLINSFLARYPEYIKKINKIVYFGCKRSISINTFKKAAMIHFGLNFVGRYHVSKEGFLPGKFFGSDGESKGTYKQIVEWIYRRKTWIDNQDRFNYKKAAKVNKLPPGLYLVGKSDNVLGEKKDVEFFIKESNNSKHELKILGKKKGNMHDYGHIDMLTHVDAVDDHFPQVLDWMTND